MKYMWKFYFWVYSVFSILGVFSILEYTPLALVDIVGLVLNIIFIISIYCYVYKKRVLQKNHWLVVFWIMICLLVIDLMDLFILPKGVLSFWHTKLPLSDGAILFSWVFSSPGIYTTYKLSQK